MEEKYENYIIYGIIIVAIGILIYSLSGFFWIQESNKDGAGVAVSPPPAAPSVPASAATASVGTYNLISTGSTNSGDVSIDLTPQEATGGKMEVDLAVNTHSVDLSSFDLTKITTLEFSEKKINPFSAPSLGGHHINGKLVFDIGSDTPKSFTIKITGIPKVNERVFEWK